MQVVCVDVQVIPEHRDAFIEATLQNAQAMVQEPGALRFDAIQRIDAPDRFLLYEVYRDESGMAAHKQTPHYARWRDTVAAWMARPREGVKHVSLFPESEGAW